MEILGIIYEKNVSLNYVFGVRKKLLGFKCNIEMYKYFVLKNGKERIY